MHYFQTKINNSKMRRLGYKFVLPFLILLYFILTTNSSTSKAHPVSNLLILIEGVSSESGEIYVSISSTKEEFARDTIELDKSVSQSSISGKNIVSIMEVSYGTYAVSVFHDVNNNAKLDKNLFGIPKEGYGFSNNAKARFGPPDFKDATFEVSEHQTKIEITMKY